MSIREKRYFLFWLTLIFISGNLCLSMNPEDMNYGTIKGRVVDEITKKGVEGIVVDINIEDWQTLTDKDGYFKFEKVHIDGEYEIRVLIDKEPYCTETHEIKVKMEKRKIVILKDIIAKRGGAIEGTVKHSDGTPALSMSITVYAKDEIPGVYGAVLNEDGYFRVSRLPPDEDLKVVAACWNVSHGCGRIFKERIRVEKDKTKRVDFITPHELTEIFGRVTSQDGKPLRAHLTFWKNSEDMGNLLCNAEGNYSIMAIEPGNYRIHVGYGDEKFKISGDKELVVKKRDKIRLDIIISEESIEFKEYKKPKITDDLLMEENKKKSLAELKFSHNEAYNEKLKDLILDAYEDDVMIKVKSDCLPDSNPNSIRMKMINRLEDASKPIYIVISNEDKIRKVVQKQGLLEIFQCGGSPKESNYIYLYPKAFTKICGSLAAILFHELLHIVGMGDDLAYPLTKKCYGDEAVDSTHTIKW